MLRFGGLGARLLGRSSHATPRKGFAVTASVSSYDVRRVEITPLEQRKLTFDTHSLVRDLEAHGFAKEQAQTIVSALMALSGVSLDAVYKDMVTQAQQIWSSLRRVNLQNLRAENEKMKIELDQVKQQLMNETSRIRADNKLDINLERSRVTDMFTDQEKKLMEAGTEFHKKDSSTNKSVTEVSNKIDAEIAALKTLMESNKLDTIRYLAASLSPVLAIALGFLSTLGNKSEQSGTKRTQPMLSQVMSEPTHPSGNNVSKPHGFATQLQS
uniref:Coiled-coil domain-containing protein 90B, mitochondrial n=1 Tax=Sphaerodactylus townsendi TaxID=933632 RepID=A0ACB8FFM1_9SAUR